MTKHRIISLLTVCLWLLSLGQADRVFAHGNPAGSQNNKLVSPDTKARLEDIERRRKELQAKVAQVRKNEQLAMLKLSKIQSQLNVTTGALNDSKHKLHKTETKLTETQVTLDRTKSDAANLSDKAANRLREIYEGQRLNLVEMVFQVQSLQALIDLLYYQERVADMDRKILAELRVKSAALSDRKDKLGEQKNMLGDLVSEFAKKCLSIGQQKMTQEQIAAKFHEQRAYFEKAEHELAVESERLEDQIRDLESGHKHSKDMVQGSGNMSLPLRAPITSPFGVRRHPIFGFMRMHTGVDLAGPNHAAIKAADSGNVLFTGYYGGYGKVVILSHGKGMSTLYAHMSRVAVSVGQNVQKGDVVGYEGSTGFSTGPHLHFEVRVNGKPNNPLNYVR